MRWALAVVVAAVSLVSPVVASGQATDGRATPSLVVTVAGSQVYHLAECPVVKGAKAPMVMSPAQAQNRGLTAHDCRKAITNAQKASVKEQLVWVDLKTKRYHLTGCSLVGLPRAQMPLDQAMKSYKPCNACKPPRLQ